MDAVIIISSIIFILCEVGVIIEVAIDALRSRRRKREEKNAQYKDYNELLQQIEQQIQRHYAYAEHQTGEARARREGIANGLEVAARMIKGFYEEG